MNIASLQRRVAPRLAVLLLWLGCFAFFQLVQGVVHFFAFPIGGGAFHAMFAYSEGGRSEVAFLYFGYIVIACVIANFLLEFFRVGVPWWWLALVSVFVSFMEWDAVTMWTPVSSEFRRSVTVLAWCLPALCFLASLVIHWICARYAKAEDNLNP